MRKLNCFFLILTLLAALMTGGVAETGDGAWDCPNCGRTGNTGNFCGGCGQPKPDKAEATDPEIAPFRKMIDRLEAAYARNPISQEETEKAWIEAYGSAEAVQALEKDEVHYLEYKGTLLGYWHNDYYDMFFIQYSDENGNPAYRRDYVRILYQEAYDQSEPTYASLFEASAKVDSVTSSSGKTYYLWHQESGDQYAETEYHDARTVTRFIVWSDTDWYNQ